MNDNKTRIEMYGRVATGWRATLILLLIFGSFVGAGFQIGWQAGVQHSCVESVP